MKLNEIPKEVYEALNVINDFCHTHDECEDCPFFGIDDQIKDECFAQWNTPNVYHKYIYKENGKYYVKERD